MNKKGMFISSKRPPQLKKSISYGGWESEKLNKMEKELMEHYGKNYSQLLKDLAREKYYALKAAL